MPIFLRNPELDDALDRHVATINRTAAKTKMFGETRRSPLMRAIGQRAVKMTTTQLVAWLCSD